MKPKEDAFIFDSYSIQTNRKEIHFNFKCRDLNFTEKIFLPKQVPDVANPVLLAKAFENLHLILGISYYKMHCSKKIAVPYSLTHEQAQFWNTVYTKGLGEFFYKNKIDFRNLIDFPYLNKPSIQPRQLDKAKKNRFLVGIGGGKDSIVAIELLKKENKQIDGLILETGTSLIQQNVAKVAEINYLVIKRRLDEKLLKYSKNVFNGHVPFSAIFAFVALLISVIYDYSFIVTANEKSSSFGNINYLGNEINHQWSKSEEFENLFKEYVRKFITTNVNYYSILRKYSELEITQMFVKFDKYFPVFSSCNKNFRISQKSERRWCGVCPKCAFVFIMLSSQLPKEKVIFIFDKNMLNDKNLTALYIDLIGKGSMKPFECVGTFEESQQALKIIINRGEFSSDKVIKEISI